MGVGKGIRLTGIWTKPRQYDLRIARALPIGLCLAGLAACTWFSFRLGQSFAFAGFLDLVLVVLAAMYGGFWQATIVSVLAIASLNYFFIPPIFSFENSPANWVALGAFEFTALVISRLSLRANLRAAEAVAGRRDMERLYETSRRILLLNVSGESSDHVTSMICEIFRLRSVQLFDAHSGVLYRSGEPTDPDSRTQNAYLRDADTFDQTAHVWYCVIRAGMKPVGALALSGTTMARPAATALASLCGIALERARALQRESSAQAARRTEQLRTAVLDAMAHQFKTPLTVARTASSGLLAVGGLTELQIELISTIDQQASKLEHLASRLLTAARLDSDDFRLQREPVLLSRLARTAVQRLEPQSDCERFRFSDSTAEEKPVLADRELMITSIGQLLDNAIKYSEPGSLIDVILTANEPAVLLTVRSKGLVIAVHERERVFERFYRAPETQHLPAGTGLGLSIVKKIVTAHRGNTWAEGEAGYGTLFHISMPSAPEAANEYAILQRQHSTY
jgi:two-component system sensor histidine kinase KdpD